MNLTPEQQAIINSNGNIKINAIAGSGKTTTVVEYAINKPAKSKILYLAFNKTVKDEAIQKFEKKGATNVTVETAHSLAYAYIVHKYHYNIINSYKAHELALLLELEEDSLRHGAIILANHVNKLTALYCNSNKKSLHQVNYLATIIDPQAKGFVTKYYEILIEKTQLFINKMDKGEADVTHDFYLKKFQLSNPKLYYDYIIFDEGQDASEAMLDIFLNQETTKIIVGDTHQQIYGWRYAINSLEKTDFKTFNLSTSFRFNQNIADLASQSLDLKRMIGNHISFPIQGKGQNRETNSKAIIARTNLGLLVNAIEYVVEEKKAKKIYFEGNINSYTYAEDGASLFDVLNLYTNKKHLIRDLLIKGMKDIVDLESYVKITEDKSLGMLIEIVKKYGNKIPAILKEIKAKHINSNNKEDAEVIFSTVHRSKGMEYDSVILANDFIDEEKIQYLKDEYENTQSSKINEEINLLYVAITRTKNKLYIPENLLPLRFPECENIIIVPSNKDDNQIVIDPNSELAKEIQKKHNNAFKPWTFEQEIKLKEKLTAKSSIKEISVIMGRSTKSIRAKMDSLKIKE
ncbi:MAG: ATP-dependent helicase [Gelidibacter sp.]|nr:ATP-dependent helicase [Gelidibacter sp.]